MSRPGEFLFFAPIFSLSCGESAECKNGSEVGMEFEGENVEIEDVPQLSDEQLPLILERIHDHKSDLARASFTLRQD